MLGNQDYKEGNQNYKEFCFVYFNTTLLLNTELVHKNNVPQLV